jgi:hypothetical protein
MRSEDLYHGANGEHILGILKQGMMTPVNGELFFVKHDSQLQTCFVHGADQARSAAFVVKLRVEFPEGTPFKAEPRHGNLDTWVLRTASPVRVQVLKLFVRFRPGQPLHTVDGAAKIREYLEPKPFHITIDRKHSYAESIGGELLVNGSFLCYTLELAWLWNANNKSCIPPGRYRGFLRFDKTDGWRIQLSGIPGGRKGVQIHVGNYPRDIEGCVLIGTTPASNAVLNSGEAYAKLRQAYTGAGGDITVEFKGLLATPWGDYPSRPANTG